MPGGLAGTAHIADQITAVDFDGDEAVAEAIDGLDGARTRGGMFRGAGAFAGAGAPAALLPRSASARSGGSNANDIKILNYALTLEYREAAFYASALKRAGLTGEWKRFATTVHAHEKAHVEALRRALGSAAVKRPAFAFGSAVQSAAAFTATSIKLEDTGVQAHQGQAPLIRSKAVFEAAISIHPVESPARGVDPPTRTPGPGARRVQPGAHQEPGAGRGDRDRLHEVRRRPMLSSIGPMELIIVLALAPIVLGPKRLPDAGKSLGRGLREFKGAISGNDDEDRDRDERELAAIQPKAPEPERVA